MSRAVNPTDNFGSRDHTPRSLLVIVAGWVRMMSPNYSFV